MIGYEKKEEKKHLKAFAVITLIVLEMALLNIPSNPNSKKEYKLCVLGEGGVGKSCLVNYSKIILPF